MSDILLEVQNLKTQFKTDEGSFFAVDDVSFSVKKGQTLGIDRKSTRLNSSHTDISRMPSSA